MKLPTVKGIIKRRLLINFHADPEVVQHQLPAPFRPKLQNGYAVVGICLIRLEHIRPKGLPGLIGISSENAAHRIAVQWDDPDGTIREGVFIPRRDTNSPINYALGGRLFPGEHHRARFSVEEDGDQIDFRMKSLDGDVAVKIEGVVSDTLPETSIFPSIEAASGFFEAGSLGYSPRSDDKPLDGMILETEDWVVEPLSISSVSSSYFSDREAFPEGSIKFDHALIMRDVNSEWHASAEAPAQESSATMSVK